MVIRTLIVLPVLAAACDSAWSDPVSFESLLDEMVDRDELPRSPVHEYTLLQASSYDRRSVSPDEGWYANADGSGFVRTETNHGRVERVLMDVRGPGAIVRFWSTYLTWTFSDAKLRFYFDGADSPQIEGSLTALIHGTGLVAGVLAQSTGEFVENAHTLAGRNLYLPLPFASGCKVTYEGEDSPFYYAINYRSYAEGAPVETFSMADLRRHALKLASTQRNLLENPRDVGAADVVVAAERLIEPGQAVSINVKGQRAIRQMLLRLEADDHRQALRSTVVEIRFDGEPTVWAPAGDFFGAGYRLAPYESRYHKVSLDGTMLCRWVMPFRSDAVVRVHNHGDQPVHLKELAVHHAPWRWDQRSLYFHASWRQHSEVPSARGRDTNYVTLRGAGKYVGDSLAVFNATTGDESQPWWGEGDEKIYIDGEAFPSSFGTGTEDYYGYAWVGSPTFSHPFLAQPISQGNRGRGLTVNSRWRALDAIPFDESLKLDMEVWHWVDGATLDYAPTTFWYGPRSTRPVTSLHADPIQPRPNDLVGVRRPVRFVDRYEAEGMAVSADHPATFEVRTVPDNKRLSNRSYRLIRNLTSGDAVDLGFYVGEASCGSLELVSVRSPRSMVVDFLLNDEPVAEGVDLYGDRIEPYHLRIPEATLIRGANRLTVRAKANGPARGLTSEVGVDCLKVISE